MSDFQNYKFDFWKHLQGKSLTEDQFKLDKTLKGIC